MNVPCPSSMTAAVLLLALPLASAAGLALAAPADALTRPSELDSPCGDFAAADDESEACFLPSQTFLLQVVLQVQPNSTGIGGPHKEALPVARHVPFARSRPRREEAAALQHRGRVWTLSDVFQASSAMDVPGILPADAVLPADPDDPEPELIPEHGADKRVALSSAVHRNESGKADAPPPRHRRISKRVFIVLEMVPASALLGLDRLYICDGCPFESDGTGSSSCGSGEHCYLGFLKLMISIMAFLHSTRLVPVALIWWFIDAGFIIDNCVRGADTINIFGMVATFDESTVEEARKLSLAAAGQFGLELALFLPAVFALLAGSRTEGFHGRIQEAIEGLRPPHGASESAIESSTSTLLYQAGKAGADNEDVCSICCDVFQENDRLRVLPCKHHFHAACVDRWLCRNCTCPLCKGDITCGGRQQEEDEVRGQTALVRALTLRSDMSGNILR